MLFQSAAAILLLAAKTIARFSLLVALLVPQEPGWAQTENQTLNDQTVDESVLPTGRKINPAGDIISFNGRPVDLRLSHDGKRLFVKDRSSLRIIDVPTWELLQTIESPDGASAWGLAVTRDDKVYFSNAKSGIHVFAPAGDSPRFTRVQTIELPNDSYPCGIELSADESTAYVCLSKKNSLAIVDLGSDSVLQTINVGVAPFDVHRQGEYLYVSNIGGRRSTVDDPTAPSAGTATVVDERGIASTGTVTIFNLTTNAVENQVKVGLHPSVLSDSHLDETVVVCNTNDDSISFVNADSDSSDQVVVKPDPKLAFGSMPSSIDYLPGLDRYLVALAGNNAVAVLKPDPATPQVQLTGLIPTAWYPVALAHDQEYLFVACVKGRGARAEIRPIEKGKNSHDHLGTIQKIPLNLVNDPNQLQRWTSEVTQLSRIVQIVGSIQRTAENDINQDQQSSNPSTRKSVPIPDSLSEPSLFKHVIYVIKENRTFDQVFGDLKDARSDPQLCIFPETVTPNHHALARRYGVLDNYYCNGVLSADGHSWATEGNVTPYLERSFGGFARSYTFGDDPITYSSSGFLWDHVLAAGLSFRNYGEMDYAEPPAGMKYQEIWNAFQAGEQIEFEQNIGIERLRRYSCPTYPGWNMVIPDVVRMERFLAEFREFKKTGDLPNLTIIYLPQDHLGGGVTSKAHMADNDLALGRLVDAVSHSQFWKDTVIFVNEDDPQNGYDHIDGHRSLCLVISPYSRPGINHQFYNQTSVLRTILHVFGLPPMNQQDASMPLMKNCFQLVPDFNSYDVIAAKIPLNQTPVPETKQSAVERKWRKIVATVPIERTGMKTEQDEDNLNRFVWHEVKGWNTPYPDEWSGAHARGLKTLGLEIDPAAGD